MTWHGYLGIENLALNAQQRQALVQALRALGPTSATQPALLNHWRLRLDGQAAIFEAAFSDEALTVPALKGYLANVFGIDPNTISHSVQTVSFRELGETPIVILRRNGTDYVRVALFGGMAASREESLSECVAYLIANQDEWDVAT